MKNYFFDPNVSVNVEVKEHYEYFIDLIDNYLMYEYLYQMQLKFKYFSWKSEIKVEIHIIITLLLRLIDVSDIIFQLYESIWFCENYDVREENKSL